MNGARLSRSSGAASVSRRSRASAGRTTGRGILRPQPAKRRRKDHTLVSCGNLLRWHGPRLFNPIGPAPVFSLSARASPLSISKRAASRYSCHWSRREKQFNRFFGDTLSCLWPRADGSQSTELSACSASSALARFPPACLSKRSKLCAHARTQAASSGFRLNHRSVCGREVTR
jgi:hypothetical protein